MTETSKKIVEAIEEKKGEKIVSIDLRTIDGTICNEFIICEAQSTTQVDAIANEIEDMLINTLKEKPLRVEGKENSLWIIMDYGDVFVHIFEKQTREFYNLERLWSDAPIKRFASKL